MLVHDTRQANLDAIAVLHRRAFGGSEESTLVDALHADGYAVISLVAEDNDIICGHILFSPLTIATESGPLPALALAPVGVLPEKQRKGIGSQMINLGLARARAQGYGAVIVVGNPAYYSRFGFSSALARELESPYSGFGDAWMALELAPGFLYKVRGVVRYAPPFQNLPA